MSMIKINDKLCIDEREVSFTYSQSPGPGGQNVNKVATKVTLRFDVMSSRSLSWQQRRRILDELASRISRDGMLRVVSWRHRTQVANRRDALMRFTSLLTEALRPRPVRKKTKPSRAVRERRLREKRLRSRQKQIRSKRYSRDDD